VTCAGGVKHAARRAVAWLIVVGLPAVVVAFSLCAHGEVEVRYDSTGQFVDVSEDGAPVLRYHHGVTKVPDDVDAVFERGDYVSALYGLNGELLTEDFPRDHVHHRGVNWSWATIQWNGETRDMFGIRTPYTGPIIGGLWARPVKMIRAENGVIEAESVWKWDDKKEIVRERVVITVQKRTDKGRTVDFEITLTPLVEGIEFCGRLEAGYSGFNVRMAPGEGQRIDLHVDEPDAAPRRAWADYSAEFPGGNGRSGLAILQHPDNPGYPNAWREYPELNFFQPLYPGGELIPMPQGKTIVLRYRLWIHSGNVTSQELAEAWDTSMQNAKPTIENAK